MGRYVIEGGRRLRGVIPASGAKNAALPILAATVLTSGESILHRCPRIADVSLSLEILKGLGAAVTEAGDTVIVDAGGICRNEVSSGAVQKMRASILFLGALLGRFGEAKAAYPGGCAIGERPIDLHLEVMKALGAEVTEEGGIIHCRAKRLRGTRIRLRLPSVGATENCLLAAAAAEGTTVLENAAREPEIVDMAAFLNGMGADIRGAGTETIVIEGTPALHGTEHTVIPDRIEGATYLTAAAITGGEVFLSGAGPENMVSTLECLRHTGCIVKAVDGGIWLKAPPVLAPLPYLETGPFPAFPTDMQPQIMALLTLAEGTSMIRESIFESRYRHVPHLAAMGADIVLKGRDALITGVPRLHGALLEAEDLRGGAALTLAALAAEGGSVLNGARYLERGYEGLVDKLTVLGAQIRLEEEETH